MAHENSEDGLIRRYLLGQLEEDELGQLEEKMMADNELFNMVLLGEDEMVEEYVQRELSESDRARFEASFLSTPQGREKVAYAKALRKHVSKPAPDGTDTEEGPVQLMSALAAWWKQLTFSPSLRLAASLVIVLGFGLGIWRVYFYQSDVSKGIAALAYAYREQRPVEARISGFNYAPAARTRGDEAKVDRVALNRAERILLDEVSEHPSSASHHALGRLYLAEQEFDDAIIQFEEALKTDPNNAQLHSDYGAALLEKGRADIARSGLAIEDLGRALEHLDRAVELDASLLEALFNRALVLESLNLTARAEEAWKAYLEKDSRSKWADEGREHLRQIEQRITTRMPQSEDKIFREFISGYEVRDDSRAWDALRSSRNSRGSSIQNKLIEELVLSAANSAQANDRTGLQALRYVAHLENTLAGDSYTSDTVAFYERVDPRHRPALATGRSLMRTAFEHFVRSDCAEAIKLYSEAERIFEQTGNDSELIFTRYRLAHCYIRQAERERARHVFEGLYPICKSKRYRWLLAQCEYQLADIKMGLTEYSEAIDHSKRAQQLFETYDTYGAIAVLVQLADEHRRLNDVSRSLGYVQRGLRLAAESLPDLVPVWGCCTVAAFDLNLMGYNRAALEFQTEALELALAMDRPLLISRSYEYAGLTNGKLSRHDKALECFQRAFDVGNLLSGESAGVEIMAHSSLLLGDTHQEAGDPTQALSAYSQSIDLYKKLGFAFYNYDNHKGRLRCYLALGDDASAEKEIELVTRLLEEHRSKMTAEQYRNTFFDIEQRIVDAIIDFKYSRGHNEEAYEYSELCRARSLLALMKSENGAASIASAPLKLAEIQDQMPGEVQLLQYSVLNDKVIAWLVTKQEIKSAVNNIDFGELKEKALRYLGALKRGSEQQTDEATDLAARLYEILVGSIAPSLDKTKELVIVPDKVLSYLPFHALTNSNKCLLEDYCISYAPSSTAFVINSVIAKHKSIPIEEKLLSVGGPRLDRSLAQKFRDLPSARKEAKEVARYYKDPWVLVGENARRSRVQSLMEKSDVVLLATHYDSSPRSSNDSRLLLAAEPKQSAQADAADGVLTCGDVLKLDLSRLRLVVLSACNTGIEQVFAGEGAISMARPFIAKGVPLVVASLWAVNSEATADLMIRFHRYRKLEHLSTSSALRQAQLDAVHGQDGRYRLPYYWAGFVTIGGYKEF